MAVKPSVDPWQFVGVDDIDPRIRGGMVKLSDLVMLIGLAEDANEKRSLGRSSACCSVKWPGPIRSPETRFSSRSSR